MAGQYATTSINTFPSSSVMVSSNFWACMVYADAGEQIYTFFVSPAQSTSHSNASDIALSGTNVLPSFIFAGTSRSISLPPEYIFFSPMVSTKLSSALRAETICLPSSSE